METITTQCPTTSDQHKGVQGKYWVSISRSPTITYAQDLARDIIQDGEDRARTGPQYYQLEANNAALQEVCDKKDEIFQVALAKLNEGKALPT